MIIIKPHACQPARARCVWSSFELPRPLYAGPCYTRPDVCSHQPCMCEVQASCLVCCASYDSHTSARGWFVCCSSNKTGVLIFLPLCVIGQYTVRGLTYKCGATEDPQPDPRKPQACSEGEGPTQGEAHSPEAQEVEPHQPCLSPQGSAPEVMVGRRMLP